MDERWIIFVVLSYLHAQQKNREHVQGNHTPNHFFLVGWMPLVSPLGLLLLCHEKAMKRMHVEYRYRPTNHQHMQKRSGDGARKGRKRQSRKKKSAEPLATDIERLVQFGEGMLGCQRSQRTEQMAFSVGVRASHATEQLRSA